MKMYCQQYLFLISFILIVPDTLQGSHSKPSPFCAVGRAVNKHPVLIKKYCGPHVIGCLRSETKILVDSQLHYIREHECGPPFDKRLSYTFGCDVTRNKRGFKDKTYCLCAHGSGGYNRDDGTCKLLQKTASYSDYNG